MGSMPSNLSGRLRNTKLSKTQGLMPLFEAVVNSIHAIEEIGESEYKGRISIVIDRESDLSQDFFSGKKRGPDAVPDISGFRIVDNGIGFNNVNFISFKTLDTDHKLDKGCRGVGRLLWLKAFKNIRVASTYITDKKEYSTRKFLFTKENGISDEEHKKQLDTKDRKTIVELIGFKSEYRQSSRKTLKAIGNHLFEHCLWYFIREGGAPEIVIEDSGEKLNLADVYEEHMQNSSLTETMMIDKVEFELTHVKLTINTSQANVLAFCASSRLVKQETINGKLPGLFGRLKDGENEFIYACYLTSKYLDERVNPERTDFNFEDDIDSLFRDNDITIDRIRSESMKYISSYLASYLEEKKKAGRDRVTNFIDHKAPRYRPILSRISEDEQIVDPEISDKDLELKLHKHLNTIESKLISEGHKIMSPQVGEDQDSYRERVQEYITTASDIKRSDLASYVSHRKVILDLLSMAIEKDENGKYKREYIIHQLLVPMRSESNDLMSEELNLWVIDERLAFHNYLASDKTINSMPITDSTSTKEPDIAVLNVFDNPLMVSERTSAPYSSIVIVEIKRPMRNDVKHGQEDKDPVQQVLGYLDRIRKGNVQTANGRPIPKSSEIPGFCYIICDLTETLRDSCRRYDPRKTSDGLGLFFHNSSYNAYIEIISFDRIVDQAKQRNRAFFDRLGLPTN